MNNVNCFLLHLYDKTKAHKYNMLVILKIATYCLSFF